MSTFNTILDELQNVPADRLEDLRSIIHALQTDSNKSESARKKILSFAGVFSDMSEEDYRDLLIETSKTRTNLLDREFVI